MQLTLSVPQPFQTRPLTVNSKKSADYCMNCSNKATIEALFDLDGAVLVRKYCDDCLLTAKYEE